MTDPNEPLPMGGDPEKAPPSQPPPDPWSGAKEAGFDPANTDWNAVAEGMQYLQALQDPNQHYDVLERSLQAWGHLPQGQSLSDVLGARGPQPPGQPAPAPQAQPQQGEFLGWDPEGNPIWDELAPQMYGPQQPPGQPGLDPSQLEERIIKRMREEVLPEHNSEVQSQLLARDLDSQMQTLIADKGLSEGDAGFLWQYVVNALQANDQNIGPQELRGFVQARYNELEQFANQRMGQVFQQQEKAPQTTPPAGLEAAPEGPNRQPGEDWIAQAVRRTGDRLGVNPLDR